jgi:hypothetical protein
VAEELAEALRAFGRGGQAESGEFDVDVGRERFGVGQTVEGDRKTGLDGPTGGIDLDGEAAAGEFDERRGSGVGEADGDDERVIGQDGKLARGEAGDESARA